MFLFTPCMECYGYANCLRIPINRQEDNKRKDHHGTVGKLSSEQQIPMHYPVVLEPYT